MAMETTNGANATITLSDTDEKVREALKLCTELADSKSGESKQVQYAARQCRDTLRTLLMVRVGL